MVSYSDNDIQRQVFVFVFTFLSIIFITAGLLQVCKANPTGRLQIPTHPRGDKYAEAAKKYHYYCQQTQPLLSESKKRKRIV
jgi:hypothetical protein